MALDPGHTLLNGQYRIMRLLGRGGFGFVYLARDDILGEDVAIKELIPALVGDEIILKRFLTEAKATMRLRHRRIVATHNVFFEGGNYYIVMEYMPGGSLEDRLREGRCLAVADAVSIAADVCEGLTCAHEDGVVHCDLKPANILFAADDSAKVADFGIAHVSDQMLSRSWLTPAGFVAGTLPYMSPEQTDGVRDDPRVDVYALGAVLYRMLTGRTYIGFDPRDTPRATSENVQRICGEQPVPPSAAASKQRIPAWLDGVVLKALAKRPEDRYAGGVQMRAALLGGEREMVPAAPQPVHVQPATPLPLAEVAARQTAPPGRVTHPAAGQPTQRAPVWSLAGAAGLVLVAMIVGLAIMLGGGKDGRDGTPAASPVAVGSETLSPAATSVPPTQTPAPPLPTVATPRPRDTLAPPTATRTVAAPTFTPIPPTATTLPPTATRLPPTNTPKPAAPKAGATRTRVKDGMVMVYVPAGQFLMGSTDADGAAHSDEKPQHKVTLDAFWIDRTEVTNAQYKKCVDAGKCRVAHMPSYDPQGRPNHPVVEVTWGDARTYCEWAGARLPTEAEWEKAARETDGRIFPWGNAFDGGKLNFCDKNCEFEWKETSADDGYARTAPVGHYPSGASPYGALDMAGNAWEWVADWYGEGYYAGSPARNPKGPDSGQNRVLRGGGWGDLWYDPRAADRGYAVPDVRIGYFGFRCGVVAPGG